jgi:acetoacetyl-CoA synthetase
MLMQELMDRLGHPSFRELHSWSIAHPGDFWSEAWDDLGIVGDKGSLITRGSGFEGTQWFPEASLNIVETLLAGDPEAEVLVSLAEDLPRRSFTRAELRAEVAACHQALVASGIKPGDRVACWMPHVHETVILALGALSLGAIVSTASPDFGPAALIDRFSQIAPTFLLAAARARYGGKEFDLGPGLLEVLPQLPTVIQVVTVGETSAGLEWDAWLAPHRDADFQPHRYPFDHPGFILFSSGTTGKPKCIVHSAAGVLLKVLSEQGYHLDVNLGDRMLYATTCGWMMWNWLLCGLGRGATVVLLDGSPGYPDLGHMWRVASAEKLSFLGVSAALIDTWRRMSLRPGADHPVGKLRTIASTGSPLAPGGYDWIAEHVSPDIAVASIAGGTDLCGCLVLGVATEEVPRGEIQGPALGLDVTVFRSDGSRAEVGEDGELVCVTPFPTVPLRFWGDEDGFRRRAAYFDRFPDVWAHGDYARTTKRGGFEILGRLDATLNSKGVRIGTAEVYRVVLTIAGIREALAVAQPHDNDTRIVLFVVTRDGLTEDMISSIRSRLRSQASPRHVPALVVEAPDVPRTRSGKMTELVVADIVGGRKERDTSSLANPEALEWFREWASTATS